MAPEMGQRLGSGAILQ
nr:hypothetical protein [Marinobacter koreensis]